MTDFNTSGYGFHLRIRKLPPNGYLEGFDLRAFEVGETYEVGPRLGELLIVIGYGDPVSPRLPNNAQAADKS